jgi:hypothetical protein
VDVGRDATGLVQRAHTHEPHEIWGDHDSADPFGRELASVDELFGDVEANILAMNADLEELVSTLLRTGALPAP